VGEEVQVSESVQAKRIGWSVIRMEREVGFIVGWSRTGYIHVHLNGQAVKVFKVSSGQRDGERERRRKRKEKGH